MKTIDNNFNFTIVGGGASGWLSALFLKKKFPQSNVTVVASNSIGILGAGEGTTPEFLTFLQELDISVVDVIKEAKGTFKLGIKFTNWNKDGETYFNQFPPNLYLPSLNISTVTQNISTFALESISKGKNIDDFLFYSKLSEKNLLSIVDTVNGNFMRSPKPPANFKKFVPMGDYAVHFDTNLLVKFLEKTGSERGINLIDDEVVDIVSDDNGYITSLKLKSGNTHNLDFVFDCSGFRKLIIGNYFKANWISTEKHLPVNNAIAFFLENDDTNIPTYTEAVAMNYGWMWKIPVQGRFGCGYIYDSQHISEEEAKKEVEVLLGREITIGNTFSFNSGYFETPWIKNCISIGLSAGFFEPMEATSISTQVFSLQYMIKCLTGITNRDSNFIKIYNDRLTKFNEATLHFLYLHYLTKRTDNEFWSKFHDSEMQPDFIKNILNVLPFSLPDAAYFNYFDVRHFFVIPVWYIIMAGLKLIPQDVADIFFKTLLCESSNQNYQEDKQKIFDVMNTACENSGVHHHDYINYVLSNSD